MGFKCAKILWPLKEAMSQGRDSPAMKSASVVDQETAPLPMRDTTLVVDVAEPNISSIVSIRECSKGSRMMMGTVLEFVIHCAVKEMFNCSPLGLPAQLFK